MYTKDSEGAQNIFGYSERLLILRRWFYGSIDTGTYQ